MEATTDDLMIEIMTACGNEHGEKFIVACFDAVLGTSYGWWGFENELLGFVLWWFIPVICDIEKIIYLRRNCIYIKGIFLGDCLYLNPVCCS